MKFTILLEILFELLAKRKVTASYLSQKYELSTRTIYRYVDLLSMTVPVYIKRGREGGICISDAYKLPKGFMTQAEYEATIEALALAYAQFAEPRFLEARNKISAQLKLEIRDTALSGEIGTILVDGGTWGDTRSFSDKLKVFEESIKEREVLEIEYHARTGEKSARRIEPHVLVFKQGVWYAFAFCRKQRAFRLFRIGRTVSALRTGETFQKRAFKREDIPLSYWTSETKTVDARFEIAEKAFADAQDWLGNENLRLVGGKWYADMTLPDDDGLVRKILSLGAGVKVLSPDSLKERVIKEARAIAEI